MGAGAGTETAAQLPHRRLIGPVRVALHPGSDHRTCSPSAERTAVRGGSDRQRPPPALGTAPDTAICHWCCLHLRGALWAGNRQSLKPFPALTHMQANPTLTTPLSPRAGFARPCAIRCSTVTCAVEKSLETKIQKCTVKCSA